MKKQLTLFFCAVFLFAAQTHGQTWNLTSTMTATLDSSREFTVSTTKAGGEAMPDYGNPLMPPWFQPPNNVNRNIRSVVIEDKVTRIGNVAFGDDCPNITSVTMSNSVISIGRFAFYKCYNLSSLTLSNKLETIEYEAFAACSSLASMIIPNSVKSIEKWAFAVCTGLTSVTIPNSVKSIESQAFRECTALKDVTVYWAKPLSVPANADNVFISVNTSAATLHVPAGTKALYQADPVWGTFGTIDDGTAVPTLSISPTSLSFSASGGKQTFAITSNTDWKVSSNDSWVTVSLTSGSKNGTITVTATENKATTQRTATITVSGTGVTAQTIKVTQDAAEIILALSVSPASLSFSASGGKQTFAITSNTDWKVSSNDSWVTVSPTSGSNNGTVTVTAVENMTTTQRTATITVSGTGVTSKTISVTQDAKEIPSVVPGESQSVGLDGKGTIELNLSIPSDATLTGSFEIQFPEGITPDEELTVLSVELSGNFHLSFTYKGNNTWLIEIKSNALRSSQASKYQKIMDIVYNVDEYLKKGIYEATILNLDFLLDNNISVKEDLLMIPINVERWGTSIEAVRNQSFYAYMINNTLKIESPNAELITVYSAAGVRLYSGMKNAGTIEIPGTSIPGSVFIIQGSASGTIKAVK